MNEPGAARSDGESAAQTPTKVDGDHEIVSFLKRVGGIGLSTTTLLTAFLCFIGFCYWQGYFYQYKIELWSVGVPFERYLVPNLDCLGFLSCVLVGFLGAASADTTRRHIKRLKHTTEKLNKPNKTKEETLAAVKDATDALVATSKVIPGKTEKVIGIMWFLLSLAWSVWALVSAPAQLLPSLAGQVLGVLTYVLPRIIKAADVRYFLLVIFLGVLAIHSCWRGAKDSAEKNVVVYVETKDEKGKDYRLIFEGTRGLYVEEDPTKSGKGKPMRLRFIPSGEIKVVKYQ